MAGPFQDPVDGAVFIWKGATPEVCCMLTGMAPTYARRPPAMHVVQEIQEWVAADSYVQAGLVPSW